MKNKRNEVFKEVESLLSKSRADIEEVDAILKKIKKEAFAEYRRRFRQNENRMMR